MKFILHNLRMIWSRFRSNGWVLAELFLVFVVMWFLCDSLGCLKYTFYRPLGYNIDHVYRLTTIIGGATSDTTLTNADRYLRALKKLEQEPSVEVAALLLEFADARKQQLQFIGCTRYYRCKCAYHQYHWWLH